VTLPKPNWGKSFSSQGSNAENQLVRVVLSRSHDITLYLQPLREADGIPVVTVDYHVSIGSGGIAVVNSWIPAPVFGVARHFVADTIEVSVVTPGAAPAAPRIVAANAAIGRPSDALEPGGRVGLITAVTPTRAEMASYLTKRPDTHSWVRVDPGAGAVRVLIRVPMFATHMQIQVANNTGVAAAEQVVNKVAPSGGISVQPQVVGDYATMQPVPPDSALIQLRNTNAGAATFDALVTFKCSL
jgi:hypothetical protein